MGPTAARPSTANVASPISDTMSVPGQGRKISTSDIQLVQNLIERCLQAYMPQKEVVQTLQNQAKIEPSFTTLVWQKLEEQNPDFFKAYYVRLKFKDQVIMFNYLLEQQVSMVQKLHASWLQAMMPRPGMPLPPGLPPMPPGMPPMSGQMPQFPFPMPGLPGFPAPNLLQMPGMNPAAAAASLPPPPLQLQPSAQMPVPMPMQGNMPPPLPQQPIQQLQQVSSQMPTSTSFGPRMSDPMPGGMGDGLDIQATDFGSLHADHEFMDALAAVTGISNNPTNHSTHNSMPNSTSMQPQTQPMANININFNTTSQGLSLPVNLDGQPPMRSYSFNIDFDLTPQEPLLGPVGLTDAEVNAFADFDTATANIAKEFELGDMPNLDFGSLDGS